MIEVCVNAFSACRRIILSISGCRHEPVGVAGAVGVETNVGVRGGGVAGQLSEAIAATSWLWMPKLGAWRAGVGSIGECEDETELLRVGNCFGLALSS